MSADDVQEDEPMEDAGPAEEDVEDEEDDGSSDESDTEPVAVLAVTRERRANAGNRMSKLLEMAELEDEQQGEEYGEIFAETADDVEFEAAGDDDADVNMDSSSEDEDAEAVQDEDAGERELAKQERKEIKKKRKRETLLQDAMKRAAMRVGPKAAPVRSALASSPATDASTPRPRKKSERVSWLPEAAEGAIRASSRKLAQQNKSAVHERLKEKEQHRLRTVAIMKAAEKRREVNKPKVLTQEDRLEEAARTERMNIKSFNHWEVAEVKRQEEQKARLAALKNHRLEGPIITYYSGPALWVDDKLKIVGKDALLSEEQQKQKELDSIDIDNLQSPAPAVQPASSASSPQVPDQLITLPIRRSSTPTSRPTSSKQNESPASFLHGIEEYANSNHDSSQQTTIPSVQPQTPMQQMPSQPAIVPYETPYQSSYTPNIASDKQYTGESLLAQFQVQPWFVAPQPKPAPPPQPKLPPKREIAARVFITLQDFPDENTNPLKKEPDFIRHHLLDWPLTTAPTTKKAEKALNQPPPTSKKAICAVTGQPARYCDPATGLYYVDAVALKSMRWVIASKGKWNPQTGTFAHQTDPAAKGRPAKGVPDMFLMTGEELEKRKEEVRKVRAEQERLRAEQREKELADQHARAQAQAQMQANANAYAMNQQRPPMNMQGAQQMPPYQAGTYPHVQIPAAPRPVAQYSPSQAPQQSTPAPQQVAVPPR